MFLWRLFFISPKNSWCLFLLRMGTFRRECTSQHRNSSRCKGCFFCHRPNSLNLLPHQVPIATKSACEKNVEENGHSFDQNTVCAGGNGKGTCQVFKGTLLFLLFSSCKNPTCSGPSSINFSDFINNKRKK